MGHSLSSFKWVSLTIAVLVGDQVAKICVSMMTPLGWSYEVTFFFNLVHVLNSGAAFSLLADAGGWQRWLFLAIALTVSSWLAWELYHSRRAMEGLAYSLILGGALGNAFDRAVRGQVVDYIDLHLNGWHWPAFNIADIAIVAGAIVIVALTVISAEIPARAD